MKNEDFINIFNGLLYKGINAIKRKDTLELELIINEMDILINENANKLINPTVEIFKKVVYDLVLNREEEIKSLEEINEEQKVLLYYIAIFNKTPKQIENGYVLNTLCKNMPNEEQKLIILTSIFNSYNNFFESYANLLNLPCIKKALDNQELEQGFQKN